MVEPRLFGVYFAHLRAVAGRSQADVASSAGISGSNLCKLERGTRDPRLSDVLVLAPALGMTPGELIGRYVRFLAALDA